MASLSIPCPDCGREIEVSCGQSAVDGSLRWSYSFHCPDCGCRYEFDDHGFPPAELREQFLAEDGYWDVTVACEYGDRGKLVEPLKQQLGMSLRELSDRWKKSPSVLFTGTREEAKWVANVLKKFCPNADIAVIQTSGKDAFLRAKNDLGSRTNT